MLHGRSLNRSGMQLTNTEPEWRVRSRISHFKSSQSVKGFYNFHISSAKIPLLKLSYSLIIRVPSFIVRLMDEGTGTTKTTPSLPHFPTPINATSLIDPTKLGCHLTSSVFGCGQWRAETLLMLPDTVAGSPTSLLAVGAPREHPMIMSSCPLSAGSHWSGWAAGNTVNCEWTGCRTCSVCKCETSTLLLLHLDAKLVGGVVCHCRCIRRPRSLRQ